MSSRNPGIIYELPDGRKVIAYKDQPLKKLLTKKLKSKKRSLKTEMILGC